jgi:hypothetical protein
LLLYIFVSVDQGG